MSKNDVQQFGKRSGKLMPRDKRHGTSVGYYYWGCRCEKCLAHVRDYVRERKAIRNANLDQEEHGKEATYRYAGCRCEACTAAWDLGAPLRKAARDKARAARSRRDAIPKMDLGGLA